MTPAQKLLVAIETCELPHPHFMEHFQPLKQRIENALAMLDESAPVQTARARRQNLDEHVVRIAQARFVVGEIHCDEVLREYILRVAAQPVGEGGVGERRIELRGLHREPFEGIESAELTRFQHFHEIAFVHQERAFVLFHYMTHPHIVVLIVCSGPVGARRTDRDATRTGERSEGLAMADAAMSHC